MPTTATSGVSTSAERRALAEAGLPWLVAVERGANDADAVVGHNIFDFVHLDHHAVRTGVGVLA